MDSPQERKLLEGELVEVFQTEKGLRGSWHPGVVVKVKTGRRLVEYDELLSEDGQSKLIESIPFGKDLQYSRTSVRLNLKASQLKNKGLIRPRPPGLLNSCGHGWKRGLFVEVLYEDAWWEAFILECNNGNSSALVRYPYDKGGEWVPVAKLRVLQTWNEESAFWTVRGYGFLPDFLLKLQQSATTSNYHRKKQKKAVEWFEFNEDASTESSTLSHATVEDDEQQNMAACILPDKVKRGQLKEADSRALEEVTNCPLGSSVGAERTRIICALNKKDDSLEGFNESLSVSGKDSLTFQSNSTYEGYFSHMKENLKDVLTKSSLKFLEEQCHNGNKAARKNCQPRKSRLKKRKDPFSVIDAIEDNCQHKISLTVGSTIQSKARKFSKEMHNHKYVDFSTPKSQKDRRTKISVTNDRDTFPHLSYELPPLSSAGSFSKEGKSKPNKPNLLSSLIDNKIIRKNEVVWYLRKKDKSVMKEGRVTREGVLCKCCKLVWQLSHFEVHAGSRLHRPSANMFVRDGRSLAECQEQAWEMTGKLKPRKRTVRHRERGTVDNMIHENNATDDSVCGTCGDGGDLICCENCPSIFHPGCLGLKEVPSRSWLCFSCLCASCGKGSFPDGKASVKGTTMFKCAQCERKYHSSCVRATTREQADEPLNGNRFCGEECRKIFYGLQNLVGKSVDAAGSLSWILLRSGQNSKGNTNKIKKMLSTALDALLECFNPMVDNHTNIEMISHLVRSRPFRYQRLNFCGFYTLLLHKGPQVISVATIRVHGAHFAEIPFIGTRFRHRRKGMCRLLVNIAEQMLKKLKVERLILPAIPELKETWEKSFGFQPLNPALRQKVIEYNILSSTGGTLLERALTI